MKRFNNIKMYQDYKLREEYPGDIFGDAYTVEVNGNKARVHSNNPFIKKPSRFCKLEQFWWSDKIKLFKLTVNGKKAYFKLAHNIHK